MELKAVARIIQHPGKADRPVKTAPPNPAPSQDSRGSAQSVSAHGDYFDRLAEGGIAQDRLLHERKRILGEVKVLRDENRWEDILTLLHPAEDRAPELVAAGLQAPLLAEAAFALDHLGRFDEALALGRACVEMDPENFHYHSGLAYTAYNSLYAAKTRRVMLHPAERKARIELAHTHFEQARRLRPDGVTGLYRQGMLFKQIQNQKDKALPLFEAAVKNWDALSAEDRKKRHQERKNFIKSLYQLSSCLLDAEKPRAAMEALARCLDEDASSQHLKMVHKHFALGKIHFRLGQLDQARDALDFASTFADPADDDYVFELLARVHLARRDLARARQAVDRVPAQRRRPYFRWTESDVLVAEGDPDRARRILVETAERDRRSRHKALLRLVRIDYRRGDFESCLRWARDAQAFFWDQYGNSYADGLVWEGAALVRLGRLEEAAGAARRLEEAHPWHPHLGRLKKALAEAAPGGSSPANP